MLGDNEGAVEDFTQAIELDPSSAKAYEDRGFAKLILGDNEGAIKDAAQAIKLSPNFALAYFTRGYAKLRLGDNEGAIRGDRACSQLCY